MKKTFSNFKKLMFLCLFTFSFSSTLFAQFPSPPALICNDSYPSSPGLVRFKASNQSPSNFTNAISIVPTEVNEYLYNISHDGEPSTGYWVNTKVYTVTIPFYANELTGKLEISTDSFCNYPASYPNTTNASNWWIQGTINVNGSMSPLGERNYATGNLSIGSHNYIVKSICTGGVGVYGSYSQTCNTQNIRVVVNKMSNPVFNLTTTAFCRKNNLNMYTGYIGFNFFGTYTNVDTRFIIDFSNVLNLSSNYSVALTSIGSTSSGIGANTFNNASSGLYNVKMKFVYTNAVGSVISYTIPSGEYGWNNYSYNKTWNSCINIVKGDPINFTEKSAMPIVDPNNDPESRRKPKKFTYYPNPVNNSVTIKSSDNTNLKSIKIYDNFNILIIDKKVNSETDFQEIDLSKLKFGLYVREVETNGGSSIEKIIKN
jgi:Secretion system C-terminal sorting domain